MGLDFMEITKRMKEILHLKSDYKLAKALDTTPQAIYNLKKRGEMSAELIIRFSQKYKISVDWLLTGEGLIKKEEITQIVTRKYAFPEQDFIFIPMVSGKISAGGGLIPETDVELRVAFKQDWIKRHGDPNNMVLIRVSGDSMEPTLCNGDIVLVNTNHRWIDPQGGIYAITIDDLIMIKRLQIIYPVKKIRVISDNHKYEPFEVEERDITVNGKIIWFVREL